MVAGDIPHAVGGITDHTILAVGSPHRSVGDDSRMKPVAYEEITASLGSLECLICHKSSSLPHFLHRRRVYPLPLAPSAPLDTVPA